MATNIWSYSGQSGKRLDGSTRPFTGQGAIVSFRSMEEDRWTWTVPLASLFNMEGEYPQEGQSVSLFRQGNRFFHGTALRPDQNDYTMSIEVVGPWYWLERVPLSTAVTLDAASGGGAGQRATIGFPAQSMTTSLGALIDRCIALGVPMAKGTIATTFSCIPITLNQGSCADALSDLVRMIGDMMVWFDYSGPGLPRINITRRRAGLATGSAPTETIDFKQLQISPGQFKIVAMDDLRVSQVRVPFLDRAANGSRRYQEQRAGTAELGHVMLLTASGEELDTFLPEEKLDSYFLQTVTPSGSALRNWVMNKSPGMVSAGQAAGVPPQSLPLVMGQTTFSYATNSQNLPNFNHHIPIPAPAFLNEAGQPVSIGGRNILVSETLPDWMKEQYFVEPIKVVVSLAYEFQQSTYESGVSTGGLTPPPSWWYAVAWAFADTVGYRGTRRDYGSFVLSIHQTEISAFLINGSSAGTTVYKRADYTFIAPPSGFAQGILNARNWTPYKGVIGWKSQDPGAVNYAGKCINVVGANPEFASMRAMVSNVEYDLAQGNTRITLGPPPRHSFPDLLRQVRANPNEQITYL